MPHWENLIREESKGKLEASDLNWWPDARCEMPAYVASYETQGRAVDRAGCAYLKPTSFRIDGTHVDGAIQLSGEHESFLWCSPLKPSNTSIIPESASSPQVLMDTWSARVLGSSHLTNTPLSVVDGYFWESIGCDVTTQLLLVLLSANESLKRGASPEFCILPVQTTFNTEVSKLRAVRVLLDHLSQLYLDAPWSGKLIGVTSTRSLSRHDAKNNMVRNTISATGGMCGGVEYLCIQPWNVFGSSYSDAEAARLSHNTYHLLCSESHVHEVADPLTGSYIVEKLTDCLVKQAWIGFNELRELSLEELLPHIRNRLFPPDREGSDHSKDSQKRHSFEPKQTRIIVGQTHFVDSYAPVQLSSESLFPIPTTFDFEPRIPVEVSQ